MESEQYQAEIKCKNCKRPNWFRVPRGEEIKDFLVRTNERCNYCNCLLENAEKKESEKEVKQDKKEEKNEQ